MFFNIFFRKSAATANEKNVANNVVKNSNGEAEKLTQQIMDPWAAQNDVESLTSSVNALRARINTEVETAANRTLDGVNSFLQRHYGANVLRKYGSGIQMYSLLIYPDGHVQIGDLTEDYLSEYSIIRLLNNKDYHLVKKAFDEGKVNDFRTFCD